MLKVLHVEDSRAAQEALARAARKVAPGCSITAVATEAAALGALARETWDLVVVDLMLEEGQGFNVLTTARHLLPDALLVVLSDFSAPHVADRCRRAGAAGVFTKLETGNFARFLAARVRPVQGAANWLEAAPRAEQGWISGLL